MRQSPETTEAVVLARGPGLAAYKPEDWAFATKYGVNAIMQHHYVKHLIALDDPWMLTREAHNYNDEEWDRVLFLRDCEPEYFHIRFKRDGTHPVLSKKGYTITRTRYFEAVGLFDPLFAPHWLMSAFTAAALAARHGHKRIVVYGVNVTGHKRLENEKNFIVWGWKRLHATMKHFGIDLYIGHGDSVLNGVLPMHYS